MKNIINYNISYCLQYFGVVNILSNIVNKLDKKIGEIKMELFEIIAIGIGLAMDAFAVSICKGLSMKKIDWKKAIIIALYFGIFQAIMPVFGYFLGSTFSSFVQSVDHWIAFILSAISFVCSNLITSFSPAKT